MSYFRCGKCHQPRDADYDGCNKNPWDEFSCLCDSCDEEYACTICGELEEKTIYCKITDQYYHEKCA